MNRKLLIVMILTIVHPSIQEECNNKLIQTLADNKDSSISGMVLKQPQQYTGEICKFEWESFGTCCDPTRFVVGAKVINQEQKKKVRNFLKFVEEYEKLALPLAGNIRLELLEIKIKSEENRESYLFNLFTSKKYFRPF
jgi:hypothetical protein